ncbi:MAG: hypothetical protein U1F55_00690 [Chitinivorax sp.]
MQHWYQSGYSVSGLAQGEQLLGWYVLSDTLRDDAQAQRWPRCAAGHSADDADWRSPASGASDCRATRPERLAGAAAAAGQGQLGGGAARSRVARRYRRMEKRQPALAGADVSFAIGGGSDAAMATADITIKQAHLLALLNVIALSRATLSKIRQNLFFAFIYNLLGIPLAALGLLNPVLAGAAMALSSVSVVSNCHTALEAPFGAQR